MRKLHWTEQYKETKEGCWLWTGGKWSNGYGRKRQGDKRALAHRYVYEDVRGTIPEGHSLHHLCGNKSCVNPDHLEALTEDEHKKRHLKTHCKHGHPLTPENVSIILVSDKSIKRRCKTCAREWSLRSYHNNRRNSNG